MKVPHCITWNKLNHESSRLYEENVQTQRKELKKRHKRKDLKGSWVGRLGLIKVSVYLKLRIARKRKQTKNQEKLEKGCRRGEQALPFIKIYIKSLVMKTMHMDR